MNDDMIEGGRKSVRKCIRRSFTACFEETRQAYRTLAHAYADTYGVDFSEHEEEIKRDLGIYN